MKMPDKCPVCGSNKMRVVKIECLKRPDHEHPWHDVSRWARLGETEISPEMAEAAKKAGDITP